MAVNLVDIEHNIGKLPPLSEAVSEAIAIFDSEYVDYDLIEEKVNKDPSLTLRILKVANSPFYGFPGKINSVKHAIMIMGIHTTRNIVLTAGVMGNLQKSRTTGLDIDALWQHSTSTGVVARALAKASGVAEAEAFTAGLLHDIGKMVLDIFFTADYEPVLSYQKDNDCDLKLAEEEILGFNHADVGARVATYWKLPKGIVNACEYHHHPHGDEASPLAQITYLANFLCHHLQGGGEGRVELGDVDGGVIEALGLSDDVIGRALSELGKMGDLGSLGSA